MYKLSFLVLLFATSVLGQNIKRLSTPLSWRNLAFGFPTREDKDEALYYGYYRRNKVIPIDIDLSYAGKNGRTRFFVTIPRFEDGVPYSLAEVSGKSTRNGPLLKPYPSYDWHSSQGNDCSGITSVIRIAIDECDRLWVLDGGMVGFDQRCPAQLIVFDLNTDTEINRYRIPDNLYFSGESLLVTPIVDVADPPPGSCRKTRVYIADSTGRGIIVFNQSKRSFWRIENQLTGPDNRFGTHTIAGESFQLADGVFGMSLTPKSFGSTRYLFFHALAGETEVAVPLSVVNNRRNFQNWDGSWDQFQVIGRRGTQCLQEAISSDGYQFCAYNEPIGIFAWDIRSPYVRANRLLVAFNPETLQFVSGLKIVRNRNGEEELLVLSNRLQKYYSKTMNYGETNFRVQSCPVSDLINGSPCRSNL